MAHFAQLDSDGNVIAVHVIANDDILDGNGVESEVIGVEMCEALFGSGRYLRTSYSGAIRRKFAGIGYRYDENLDAFIPPPIFPSWVLNDELDWVPPVPAPDESYDWDEESQSWVKPTPPDVEVLG